LFFPFPVQLPFGGFNGITHATCVVSTSTLILVGSRCGRVAVFDAATMQQQELIAIAPGGQAGPLSSLQSNGSTAPKESAKAGERLGLFIFEPLAMFSIHNNVGERL
jgi:hypothetical protein